MIVALAAGALSLSAPALFASSLCALPQESPQDYVRTALRGRTVETRVDAIRRLVSLGPRAAPASATLAELVAHRDARIREAAVAALIGLHQHAVGAAPTLADLIRSPEIETRVAAMAAFAMVDRYVPPDLDQIRSDLGSNDPQMVQAAVRALSRDREQTLALMPELTALLGGRFHSSAATLIQNHHDERTVALVAERIAELQTPYRSITIDLLIRIDETESSDTTVVLLTIAAEGSRGHIDAVRELAARSGRRPELTPKLIELFRSGDRNLKQTFLDSLPKHPSTREAWAETVLEHVGGRDLGWSANRFLSQRRLLPERAIPKLIRSLDDGEYSRLAAIPALAAYGALADDAAPALNACLDDPDPKVAIAALEAILSIGLDRTELETAAMRAARHPEHEVRIHAGAVLAAFGRGARAKRALVDQLDDEHPRVRTAAAFYVTLGSSSAEDELVMAAKSHPSRRVRNTAGEAIRIRDDRPGMARLIVEAINHPVPTVQLVALLANARQPSPNQAVLIHALSTQSHLVTAAACRNAPESSRGDAAVHSLLELASALDESRAAPARRALEQMRPSVDPYLIGAITRNRHALAALECLGRGELNPDALSAVEWACSSSKPEVRRLARRLLGERLEAESAAAATASAQTRLELRGQLAELRGNPRSLEELVVRSWQGADELTKAELLSAAAASPQFSPEQLARLTTLGLDSTDAALAARAWNIASKRATPRLEAWAEAWAFGKREARRGIGLLLRRRSELPPVPRGLALTWSREVSDEAALTLLMSGLKARPSPAWETLVTTALRSTDPRDQALALDAVARHPDISDTVRAALRKLVLPTARDASFRVASSAVAAAIATRSPELIERLLDQNPAITLRRMIGMNVPVRRLAASLFELAKRNDDVGMLAVGALTMCRYEQGSDERRRLVDLARAIEPLARRRLEIRAEADASAAHRVVALLRPGPEAIDALLSSSLFAVRRSAADLPADAVRDHVLPRLLSIESDDLVGIRDLTALAPRLAETADDDAARRIVDAALGRPRQPLSEALANVAARLPSLHTRRLLEGALKQDGTARLQLLNALALHDPEAVLDAGKRVEDPKALRAIALALIEIPDHDAERIEVAKRILRESDDPAAWKLLANVGPAAAELVVNLARRATGDRRLNALACAGRIGPAASGAIPYVLDIYEESGTFELEGADPRDAILPAILASLGDRGIAVLEGVHREPNELRLAIRSALPSLHPSGEAAVLRAIQRLRLRHEDLTGFVIRRISSTDPEVARWARIACASLPLDDDNPKALELMRWLATTGDREVRRVALTSLGSRLTPSLIDFALLTEALEDGDSKIVAAAAETLGKSGERRARAALAQVLEHPEASVRRAVAEAIRRLDR